jgi:hypothetical protein
MRKAGIIIAIIAILAVAGCATTGGAAKSGGGAAGDAYYVDLTTLPLTRNASAFTKAWDDLLIPLPEFPVDVTQFQRVTIRCNYFDAAGAEITQADSNVMVTLIYDPSGDIRGPSDGPGPNTPLKEFNVGGFSGAVSTDRGVRIRLTKQPGAILFQNNSGSKVAFIEITQLAFHNDKAPLQ